VIAAAIDIGTNTTRLLIRDGDRTLVRTEVITRLGEGVDRTRRLDEAAISRTLKTLSDYRALIDEHHVDRVRAVATSASRDATNADEFLGPAEGVIGVRPEIIAGSEEGRLAFTGATSWRPASDGPFCVIDIGGGSTEFIVGTDTVEGLVSVDVGSVRLTETQLKTDPPRPEELTNALAIVDAHLDDVLRELPAVEDARTLVGVAGTITTVAAIEIGLIHYERERVHGFRLTRDAAEDVFRTLATEPLAERAHNPGLNPARADVIVGGCCILVGILRRLHADHITVSDADLLDGIVAEMTTR
jgi:exopolyphosphatase / guanosine-5'-triphosphate,3'-diphosphate pyrophosphatase